MSVKLRGHHLLCILTFIGHGYSKGFSKNYNRVVQRLNTGEPVLLVDGPDDICSALIEEEAAPHCFNCSVVERDAKALKTVREILDRPLSVGDELVLTSGLVTQLRSAFGNGDMKVACNECEWEPFCKEIAEGGYQKTRLLYPK
ncbi:hypothetical protein PsAD2_02763 [Pseudovibrio axinellae]|uniref:DUF1284 domain-containing protein n=1 Tax=Pseudovibrio axinellae TaxID=989403 RepID=A0A165XTR5_9HYPH|nr:DUF1284 domain-containing protein [Pseudovibrio axinellae]KZL18029.1 hypothetical protein PsAD2_02763 [Pseudovibrio axinellae]SER12948.1 hypothetical protein SAMN05421798_106217 [Pseudovibrio axinellae]